MDIDYSEGSYVAYGAAPNGPRVGWLENGYVSSDTGTWKFRVDGNEVYGTGGDLVGYVEDGIASRLNGQFLFRFEKD